MKHCTFFPHALSGWRSHGIYIWLAVVLALSIPATTPVASAEDTTEVQRAWDAARVRVALEQFDVFVNGALRNSETQARLNKIPAGVTIPTIIYIHGCTGFIELGNPIFDRLARSGYALIAPDSFARESSPITCPSGGAWQLGIRKAEIRYALGQLPKLPWVDQNNLFLMGHSEGGFVVAAYGGDEFKARIVSGNTCSGGLVGPIPALVTWSSRDKQKGSDDRCMGAEKRVVIDSSLHWVLGYPKAQEAVLEFLRNYTIGIIGERPEPSVVNASPERITLTRIGSAQEVYDMARAHCEKYGKQSYVISTDTDGGAYVFVCE